MNATMSLLIACRGIERKHFFKRNKFTTSNVWGCGEKNMNGNKK
jgi:hypothetical protein